MSVRLPLSIQILLSLLLVCPSFNLPTSKCFLYLWMQHCYNEKVMKYVSQRYNYSISGGHLGRSLLSDPDSHSPGLEPVNHYEKSGVLLTRRGPGAGLPMSGLVMGGDQGSSVYHMGTISRAAIGKQNKQGENQQVGITI